MVTGVDVATAVVLIVKVAVVLAAGTVTLEGTLAAALLLESATCAPPAGAGPLSVTVPRSEERRLGSRWERGRHHGERSRCARAAIRRGNGHRGGCGHRGGADCEGCGGACGRDRHAGRNAGRRVAAGKRNLRATCGSWPAQRHRTEIGRASAREPLGEGEASR